MAVQHGYGKVAGADALVFAYDTGDTRNSYKGEPTVNYVPGTYGYSVYAYVSGPVDTTVLNESNKSITAKRYTITQAINTARAAIFPSGLTAGVSFTFSFKWKYNGTTTASPSVGIDASKGNPEGGTNNNSFTSATTNTVSIGNGWYLSAYTFVFSSVPTGQCMLTFGIVTGSTAGFVGETFDIYEAQFEIKNHRTQYSSGTRSATQGLLDLTGNSSIDLTNLDGYNANAEIDFDGTNDKIRVPHNSSVDVTGSEVTFEQVIKKDTNGNFTPLHKELQYTFRITSANQIQYSDSSGWSYGGFGGHNMGIVSGNYFHMVTVKKDGVVTIYVNNLVVISKSWGSSITSTTNDLFIGAYAGDSNFMDGQIPVTKIYNRALTAAEVANNYNHYKGRFNI
jgi:hypothetical protein